MRLFRRGASGLGRTAFGGGGGAFDPATITPSFWYDPSDLSTLFQDTAGTTAVTTHNDVVRRINDKSGNGHHQLVVGAGSGGFMQYKTSGGLHWLENQGVDYFNIAGPFGTISEGTVAMAARKLSGSNAKMFELAKSNGWGAQHWSDDNHYFDVNGFSGANRISGATAASGVDYVSSFDNSVTNSRSFIRVDKTQVASDASGESSTTTGDFTLMANEGGGNVFNARFYGAIGKIGTVMTPTELGNVETWLGAKQGRTI
ncbi:MAG: hypothetical protein V4696_08175 [Pseudomonadota bacterium]